MKCPNCGACYDDGCRFCGACGTPLAPERKGTHLVPILLLIAMTILGLGVFFATGGSLTPQQPADSSAPWFTVSRGELFFDDTLYEGPNELTVPESLAGQTVTGISDGCFEGSLSFITVYLPDTVESIGDRAFAGCSRMIAVDLPPALTSIGENAFEDCDGLEAIHIPASVTSIGNAALADCDSLFYIFYDGTIDEWKALYTDKLGPFCRVCCADGNYFQGE